MSGEQELWLAHCTDNKERSTKEGKKLFVEKLKSLSSGELSLPESSIGVHTTVVLARQLRNEYVYTIDLHGNPLGDAGCSAVVNLLSNNHVVRSLCLSNCQMGVDSSVLLANEIDEHPSLVSLDVSDNNLPGDGGRALGASVARAGVRHIDFSRCNLGNTSILSLARSILEGPSPELLSKQIERGSVRLSWKKGTPVSLSVAGSTPSTAAALALMQALQQRASSSLTRVEFTNCQLHSDVAESLALLAAGCGSLRELYIGRNRLGGHGIRALMEVLSSKSKAGCKLRVLDISGNRIGDQGAEAVGTMLSSNPVLEVLKMSHNRIDTYGMKCISESLENNTNLKELSLSGNKAGISSLHESTNLVSLEMDNCRIEDQTYLQLAACLRTSQKLETLRMRSNFLTALGGRAFAQVLVHGGNRTITTVDVRGNQCDVTAMNDIEAVCSRNAKIRKQQKPLEMEKELHRLQFQSKKLQKRLQQLQEVRREKMAAEGVVAENEETMGIIKEHRNKKEEDMESRVSLEVERSRELKVLLEEKERALAASEVRYEKLVEEGERKLAVDLETREEVEQKLESVKEELGDAKRYGVRGREEALRKELESVRGERSKEEKNSDDLRERFDRLKEAHEFVFAYEDARKENKSLSRKSKQETVKKGAKGKRPQSSKTKTRRKK